MKIYAVSDMHGNLADLNPEGCDIVVIAGDFAELKGGGKWHWHDQKKWIQKKFVPWTQKYPSVEFMVVAGNHDFCMDRSKTSIYPDIDWRIEWPANVHVLDNSGIEIKGLKFYGSPNVPIISHRWAFESECDRLREVFSAIPEGVDVLITHTPPRISERDLDRSMQRGGSEAFGSAELADAIFEKKPRLAFCGHIHTGTHGGVDFNGTKIYNVSRVNEDYNIAFEPVVVEI